MSFMKSGFPQAPEAKVEGSRLAESGRNEAAAGKSSSFCAAFGLICAAPFEGMC